MNEKSLIPGMCRDRNPGQGVQPWSAGDIYPLVIERVEQYDRGVLRGTYWNVLNAGDGMSGYASYDEARAGALGYLAWAEGERAGGMRLSPFNPAAYDAELAADLALDSFRDVFVPAGTVTARLSTFNPAAYDAELAADLAADEAERLSQPEPGYGGRFCGAGGASAELTGNTIVGEVL